MSDPGQEMQRLALIAARTGDAAELSNLLSQGVALSREIVQESRANPNVPLLNLLASYGWPRPEDWPIMFYMGQDLHRGDDLVRWYLDRGVPFEPELYVKAAARADISTIQLLRQHYGKPFSGTGTLAAAAGNGRVDTVRWLLEAHEEKISSMPATDPLHDERLVANGTPLHFAVGSGSVETVQALLDAGASVNAKDQQGKTPLQMASQGQGASRTAIINILNDAAAQ